MLGSQLSQGGATSRKGQGLAEFTSFETLLHRIISSSCFPVDVVCYRRVLHWRLPPEPGAHHRGSAGVQVLEVCGAVRVWPVSGAHRDISSPVVGRGRGREQGGRRVGSRAR